jgi:hypothetical protein
MNFCLSNRVMGRHIHPMTRMRHIATAISTPSGAFLAVNLRGLLRLTLR